jgi:hypothetical protein
MIPLHRVAGSDKQNIENWLNSNIVDFLNHLSFLVEMNAKAIPMGRQY